MGEARGLLMQTLLGEAADAAAVWVLVYDEHGRSIAANGALCRELGYELDELLALAPAELSGRTAKTVERTLAALVARGTHSGRSKLRRKDGSTVEGRFIAARTRVARLDYYVSIFEPASP